MRVLGIADSDSYLKWAATLLDELPTSAERALVVVTTPVAPSAGQVRSAIDGTAFRTEGVTELTLEDLVERIRDSAPEVILLAVRGPVVRVLVRAIRRAGLVRPVFVSGFPGISFPVALKAIVYRELVDLVVVHSHREQREFALMARQNGYRQRFALARFPFLPVGSGVSDQTGGLIFAAQAKVPYTREERVEVLRWLAEAARERPDRPVVVKLRARGGEAQTHPEQWSYADLLADLDDVPENLIVADGPMSGHLAHASGLVTVSSTAALEAMAWGVPTIVLSDFGVNDRMINTVYQGSGVIGTRDDVIAQHLRAPRGVWLRDNYLHPEVDSTWKDDLQALLSLQEAGQLPWLGERRRLGGMLRRAWDRKQTLGHYDHSIGGYLALVLGTPLRAVVRAGRRVRNRRDVTVMPPARMRELEVQ